MYEKTGKTVLVIDDEPDVRLFLKTVLEDAGFDVMVASNGKEALERTTEKKPDVISLDLVMPKMSGLKFYKYIQKNKDRRDIPVIVITAHAKDEFGESDLEKIRAVKPEGGVLMVLEKPVPPVVYISAVRQATGLEERAIGEGGKEDLLKLELKEKMRTADRKALEEALRVLNKRGKGGNKR
jgi:CheY-like chemotaxis protein